jgi:diketogulonate reductase-like aldo/keto reductase
MVVRSITVTNAYLKYITSRSIMPFIKAETTSRMLEEYSDLTILTRTIMTTMKKYITIPYKFPTIP